MVGLLLRVAGLLLAGSLGGALVNGLRSDGVAMREFVAASTCGAEPHPEGPRVLGPTAALTLCRDPGVLVADVRSAARFAKGHVAGAIHLPCRATGDALGGALAKLAGKHTVIVYGDSTEEARPVAESLEQRMGAGLDQPGSPDIVLLDGGFRAWDEAGLACTSGPCPDCQERLGSAP